MTNDQFKREVRDEIAADIAKAVKDDWPPQIGARKDGGPAFPESLGVTPDGTVLFGQGGISVRDYFAAAFLTGWIATYGETAGHSGLAHELNAESAYKAADAMLKERAK